MFFIIVCYICLARMSPFDTAGPHPAKAKHAILKNTVRGSKHATFSPFGPFMLFFERFVAVISIT